jgi:hypothetical protein
LPAPSRPSIPMRKGFGSDGGSSAVTTISSGSAPRRRTRPRLIGATRSCWRYLPEFGLSAPNRCLSRCASTCAA